MFEHTIALFGEAEKGEFCLAYYCDSLPQMEALLGNPPPDSQGMTFAIQALLFRYRLIFFRVQEEGYSTRDYLLGLHFLQNRQLIPSLSAICLPGVSDDEILTVSSDVCHVYNSLLVTTEADLYDTLTLSRRQKP